MNKILEDNIRYVKDWPVKGINFVDITTMLKNPECLRVITDKTMELYKGLGITKVIGIESRGFVLSSVLAYELNAGLVLCRKPGKLPCDVLRKSYSKEYGTDTVEIHKDAISENDVVLIHDDILATGGTMKATCELVQKFNPKKVYVNFIVELDGLKGRYILGEYEVTSLLKL